MATSGNGWPASPDLRTRVIEPVSGVRLAIVDNDNVADLFTYLVQQFHKRVDDVTKPHPKDDWGYEYRPNVNNPSRLSNHSSGTAIDLDATEHPNAVQTAKTYSSQQISTVHKILAEMDGVIRWGGDYSGTPDAMHFEINVQPGDPRLAAAAHKVRKQTGKPSTPTTPNKPTTPSKPSTGSIPAYPGLAKFKDRNEIVRAYQQRLRDRGWTSVQVDGIFGDKTQAAVRAFQKEKGLKVDGIAGPATWAALWSTPVT